MFVADAFDFPMGTDAERRSTELPPGSWYIPNPYLNFYYLGPGQGKNPAYHTGIDVMLWPGGGRGQPIHACANGRVIYADRMTKANYTAWGNLIIQQCVLPDNRVLYIRYAHSNPMLVKAGDEVVRGQVLADESDAFGRYAPHLHMDFSLTSVLLVHPEDWPGVNYQRIQRDYVDPLSWIKGHRPMGNELDQIYLLAKQIEMLATTTTTPAPPPPDPHPDIPADAETLIATVDLRVRKTASMDDSAKLLTADGKQVWVMHGSEVKVKGSQTVGNYILAQLFSPYQGWIARGTKDGSEVWLSPKA